MVSIVTVVLNAAATLEQTLRSVLSQTYDHVEYIIIDGGSQDSSVDILERYENKLALWISEPDAGISDAFNKGIGFANGEVIGILNAGDWYEPDAVRAAIEIFAQRPDVEVVCGWQQYWKGDEEEFVFTSDPAKLTREMTVNHASMFVKRSVYERLGLFDTTYKYAMDYELALRLIVNDVKFFTVEKVIANMRYEGASHANWQEGLREVKQAKLTYLGQSLNIEVYYYFQLLRTWIRLSLQRMNASPLIRFYRAHFSALKKIRQSE